MSRCFPFPPPRYEKKLSTGQEDLLAKEKHKEKKRKKEKKDKEGGGSRDKHKEKKDKKEKHGDKKKAKDNDKIGSSSNQKNDTKKANEIKESKFSEALGRRIRDEEEGATNHMVEKTLNFAIRRTENNAASTSTATGMDACTNNKSVANNSVSLHRKNDAHIPPFHHKGTNGFEIPSTIMEKPKVGSAEKKREFTSLEKGRNDNHIPPFHNRRTEGVQTLGIEKQKIGDSEKKLAPPTNGRHSPPLLYKKSEGTETPISIERQKIGVGDKKLTSPVQRSFESIQKKNTQICQKAGDFVTDQKRNNVNIAQPFNKSPSQRNEGIHAVNTMQNSTGSNLVSNSIVHAKKRNDELNQLDRLVENIASVSESTGAQATENERLFPNITSTASRDRSKEKKLEDAKKEGRHKDRDGNVKKRKDKDKDRHREKKKEEKNKLKTEKKHTNHDKLREIGMKDQIDNINGKSIATPMSSITSIGVDVHNRKRKELEMNGFKHEPQPDERPIKLPRTIASSSHQSVNNGKPLAFDHITSKPISNNNIEVVRGIENNGNSFDQKPKEPLHMQKPPIASNTLDSKKTSVPLAESSKKDRIKIRPPHSDMKYLALIYSLPEVKEIPESDEQDWLLRSKKNIETNIEAKKSPSKVWVQGLRIEEADVFALPYVVPF